MADQSGRKSTLVGGWQGEATNGIAPAASTPVAAPAVEEPPAPSEGPVSMVVPVATPETPSSSQQATLPASNKARAPTGTLLKPPGVETQALQAVRFDEVQRGLEEKRRARREALTRWVAGAIVGLATLIVILYLFATR